MLSFGPCHPPRPVSSCVIPSLSNNCSDATEPYDERRWCTCVGDVFVELSASVGEKASRCPAVPGHAHILSEIELWFSFWFWELQRRLGQIQRRQQSLYSPGEETNRTHAPVELSLKIFLDCEFSPVVSSVKLRGSDICRLWPGANCANEADVSDALEATDDDDSDDRRSCARFCIS